MPPHSETVWSASELWSRDELAAYQEATLKRQLGYVAANSRYYADKWRALGLEPGDIKGVEDLRRLPLTKKADYVAAIGESSPWGSQLACAPEDIARVHFSSGTTGRPVHNCWTAFDIERWTDLFARYFYAQGLRKGDVYQVLVGYAWFVGGLAVTQGAQRVGAAVIPAGNLDSQRQIDTLFGYGTNAVFMTPSFAAHLGEVATQLGRDLRDSKVKLIGLGGEPGGGVEATRSRIEKAWGVRPLDCYGMIEFQPTAWELPGQDGLLIAEDFVFAEVIDAETHEPVPDGSPGVLVLTHLDKQACPLVRWWTGDVVVKDTRVADDGRTFARLVGGVRGRADDMLVVRGVNLFPSAIEDVIRRIPGVGGEFQIVRDDSLNDSAGFATGIRLRVERTAGAPDDLAAQVAHKIRERLTVRAVVDVLDEGTLPRSVHKAKRIVGPDE